jgi:hypothetical protein
MQCCLSELGSLSASHDAWQPKGPPQAGSTYHDFLSGDLGREEREAFEMHVLKVILNETGCNDICSPQPRCPYRGRVGSTINARLRTRP